MHPIILALLLTAAFVYFGHMFARDLRQGTITTRLGLVRQAERPKLFRFLRGLNIMLFPIALLMVAVVWISAFSRTFS